MDGEQARMVFTDPPYNVKIDGHVGGSGRVKHREFAMASGEMSVSEFTGFLRTSFRNLADACVDGAIVYICMDWRHMQEVLDAADGVFAELKNLIVWVKDNGGMGTFYRSRHELIFAFKVGTAAHVNTFELGQHGRWRLASGDVGAGGVAACALALVAATPFPRPVGSRAGLSIRLGAGVRHRNRGTRRHAVHPLQHRRPERHRRRNGRQRRPPAQPGGAERYLRAARRRRRPPPGAGGARRVGGARRRNRRPPADPRRPQ